MASEWYANELSRKQENDPDKDMSGGDGQFDEHEEFDPEDCESDGESAEKQIADKRLADAVAQAAAECDYGDGKGGQPKGWGSVIHQIKSKLKSLLIRENLNLIQRKFLLASSKQVLRRIRKHR